MIGWRKSQLAAVTLTAASVVLAFGTNAMGAPAVPAPNAQAASESGAPAPVIVILKDQLSSTPADAGHLDARKQDAAKAQAPLLDQVKKSGGTDVKSFVVGNAFSATVSPALRAQLAANPAVASVVDDQTIKVAPPAPKPGADQDTAGTTAPTGGTSNAKVAAPDTKGDSYDPNAVCPSDPSKPLLEPEALYSTHAESTPVSPARTRSPTARASRSPTSPTVWTPTTRTSSAPTARTPWWTTRTSRVTASSPPPVAARPSATPRR